jgi:hypothetical protein
MSYTLYLLGFTLVIGGLAYGAILMGVPRLWVIVGAVVLLGIAIASGAVSTRRKDPSL